MTELDRRAFLGFSTLATAGLLMDGWASPVGAQDIRGLPLTKDVATTAGRVRGVVHFGVNQFWGVPYAASTEGANRFMPPAAHAPWTGTRDCFQVGNRAPQDPDGPISEVFALDRQEPMGEDCLNLNVFTPALTGNRPVMVWLREVGALEQRRHPGHRRCARMDQEQHRGIRRESRQRHRVWPVWRGQQSDDADGDALSQRSFSPGDCDERRAGPRG
jgi:hypothetical protein